MKVNKNKSRFLTLLLGTILLTLGACGDGDDGDTSVIINPDGPQEEEDTGGSTGGGGTTINISNTVRVNNKVENNIRINSNSRVQNNNLIFFWNVQNADPVIHQQWIHRSDRCPTIVNDFNRDTFIDEQELNIAVGPRLLPLLFQVDHPSGETYTYNRILTLQEL